MSVLRQSLTGIWLAAFAASLAACVHQPPLKAGDWVKEDNVKLHLPNSGKILFELQAKTADVVKTIRCDQEIRTPRLILRRRADVIPMQVTCTQVRLSYVTFLPMDSGDYEAVAVGGRAAQRNLFSIRFDVVFDNPDYNSGGDQTIEGAKPLALNTQVNDTLAPSAGDVTDWFAFDAPKGYLWLHSGRKGEGQAEIKLYAKTKQGRGEELASTALGKPKLLHLTAPRGSYGLEVRAIPGQDVIPYWIKVMAFSASPTQVLSVVDIYKESEF